MIEATPAAKAILKAVFPSRTEIPAPEALTAVDAVLRLEAALRQAASELGSPPDIDWRTLAATTLRKLKEPPP